MKDEVWIVILAVGLFPTAVWYLLRWAGAPQAALKRPFFHALWAAAAIALLIQAFYLLR